MWQGNQNCGHRQSSLRNAQNVSYHTFCLMSSGAKKHIRDNTVCQCTVVQIYRVTPECSARESCDNIGLFLAPHGSCICLTGGTSETAVLNESTCYLDDKRFCRGEGLPL